MQQSNFITKCDRLSLQSASGNTKCDRLHYKARQVLQSVTIIVKSDVTEQLQIQATETSFIYVDEVIIRCYINAITCLYFPLALIRLNSSHCHLIELFKSKGSCKENL